MPGSIDLLAASTRIVKSSVQFTWDLGIALQI